MLSIAEAQARILATVPAVRRERAPLEEAFGRVLAEDVVAGVDVPPWDNSAMDGYAVRAEDTASTPVSLALRETVGAGATARGAVGPGEAIAIMTGAPLPPGADAVVMLEDTDRARVGRVEIRAAASAGRHVRRAGEDIRRGTIVLRAGATLGPAAVGMLGSLGQVGVAVARRPVVAVVGTGDEVVRPGSPLGPGQIWSSNHLSLRGWVQAAGGVPVDGGTAPDTLDGTVSVLRAALADADVVLTTGGVSVGHFDVVKEAFAAIGAPVDFWKVDMKPGKPLAFGRCPVDGREVVLFGLPGNPVSCVVNFLQFVRPWIRSALGDPRPHLPQVEARLLDDLRDGPGRARLFRVALALAPDGAVIARAAGLQSSGVLTGLVHGHGLALVAADAPAPRAGDRVVVQVFDEGFRARADA